MKKLRPIVALVLCALASGCDSGRLSQFSSFAAAGSQYVQNFHQLTAQAGSAMIASDSAVLIVARAQAGDALGAHRAEFTNEIQINDRGLEEYLATIQKLDAHATLLGSYFAAISDLTNGSSNARFADAADTILDSINRFNPEIEKTNIGGQPIKNFIQPATSLVVDHFAVRALDEQLKKAAPAIDVALGLQEAAVDALTAQIKSSQAVSLEIRESTDVVVPYVSPGNLPASWTSTREAFIRDKATINGLSSARSAIAQLRATFRELVQNKNASPDIPALIGAVEKMSVFTSAVKSTSAAQVPQK
jgi:hypothetical protein